MRKKILSVMLTVCMVLALMPQMAFAETSGATTDGFSYTISDAGEVTITGYNGTETTVEIPYEIEGKTVTTIGQDAFKSQTTITSVTIPDSVKTIGNNAFNNCYNLTSVTIPDSVKTIGENAFLRCNGLTSVTIPNGVISIGTNAFGHCTGLTSIAIPSSVTSIGSNPFYNCSKLTSIKVDDSNTSYSSVDGVLFNKGQTVLAVYPCGKPGTSYTIPYSVTSIKDRAFNNCENLTSVEIPGSVTSIGDNAFFGCQNLKSVEIPGSVTSIGTNAFSTCARLISVILRHGVTSIGDSAFYKCENLTSVEIPSSVTSIGDNAFSICRNLTSVEIPGSVTSIGVNAFYECIGLESIFLPDKDALSIGQNAIPDTTTQVKYSLDTNKGEVTITGIALGTDKTSVAIPATICGYPVVAVAASEQNNVGEHIHVGTATCKTEGTCTICGEPYILPHDFSADKKTAEALKTAGTCKTEAEYYYSCAVCDSVEKDDNHIFTGEKDSSNHTGGTEIRGTKDATCTEEGYTGDTYCKGCGVKISTGSSTNKLPHDLVNTPAKEATVTETGNKEYWQCTVCDKYFSDAEGTNEITDLESWKAGEGKIDKLIPPKTDSVTSDKDGNVSVFIEKSITINDGVAGIDITDIVAEAILSGLEASESKSVVITAVTRSSVSGPSAAKPGTSIQINLPESAVKKLAEIEGIKITIVTDNGSIVLDKGTLEAIASKSGDGGKVTLVIETVEQTGSLLKLELTLKTSEGKISDFGSGSVEVTVAISDELMGRNPVCVYIDEQGIYHLIGGKLNEDGTFTFASGHFSTYAIMPEEDAEAVIKVQTADAQKAAIKEVKPSVSLTTKKVKKGIKVNVKVPASKKADKTGVIIYRSQKKSSGYVLYKKVRTSGSSYTVTNTKNIKGKRLTKGKRYYYKARAYKVIDGKTYYGPMSAVKYAKAR